MAWPWQYGEASAQGEEDAWQHAWQHWPNKLVFAVKELCAAAAPAVFAPSTSAAKTTRPEPHALRACLPCGSVAAQRA